MTSTIAHFCSALASAQVPLAPRFAIWTTERRICSAAARRATEVRDHSLLLALDLRGWSKALEVVIEQLSNTVDADVGRGTARKNLWIPRVVALLWENSGDPRAPGLLDRGQDVQFIIDHHVMVRRVARFHIRQFSFFVNVNEHTASDRFAEPGPVNFARLKNDIAIGE